LGQSVGLIRPWHCVGTITPSGQIVGSTWLSGQVVGLISSFALQMVATATSFGQNVGSVWFPGH
jgi:hypothetical protein